MFDPQEQSLHLALIALDNLLTKAISLSLFMNHTPRQFNNLTDTISSTKYENRLNNHNSLHKRQRGLLPPLCIFIYLIFLGTMLGILICELTYSSLIDNPQVMLDTATSFLPSSYRTTFQRLHQDRP